MEAEEGKISVWVCREEKLISGLSRRTTCADVVRVLLDQHQGMQPSAAASVLAGSPESYCVVEKWRGFERILPNKSKILRLWHAWGDEQENVRFVLVKQDASLPNSGPRSAEARVVPSKESPCVYQGTARVTMAFSQEKQRRIVRKAFRKLEKINKKRAQALSRNKPAMEKMETLVHLIVSQDHTIRQQVQRIHELDKDIDRYEAKVHFDRVRTLGTNYVQNTYLVEKSLDACASSEGERQLSPEVRAEFEEYTRRCEEVLKLQEELSRHEALLDSLTAEITEELNQRWMERRKEESSWTNSGAGEEDSLGTSQLALDTAGSSEPLQDEEERIKTQLDTSLYIGLRLTTDLEAIRSDLDSTGALWTTRESELRDLLERVRALDLCSDEELSEEVEEREPLVTEPDPGSSVNSQGTWVEQARGLSKSYSGNDDDSDTGLSSLHSQDSDSSPLCESLV
ncbi:hypothetical protein ACEWY4_027471 [Coilia grayii]|uniref:Ras-associating domain-containing protein n=1 Tax=Coilia grayii TaxID=363190 RepID=A0ABD1IPK6_9TELE